MMNAMTIDVEDYFHVSAFASVVSPAEWPGLDSRVTDSTARVLGVLEQAGVHATFFVLGWVAERFPGLVRRISDDGHEIASHSFDHGLVYDKSAEAFREDLRRAAAAIHDACGVSVRGYRAPSYSITERSMWALDVLAEEGYEYDSSIYPIHHDRYGVPTWTRHIHTMERASRTMWELPGSTVRHFGVNLPVGGGGYFRLLPYGWTRRGIRRLNDVEGQPAVFYLHPWELDPGQPRLNVGLATRIRHYHNLAATEDRLRELLRDFRFGPVRDVLRLQEAAARRT
ncbi:MAG: DUF3473 domain-containing protein [Acidobacteria bacterium]|nr:DUF3473 domain-containing protein [Acidobacteriota bacterium]